MDELTVMQGFRAERDAEVPEAREAIWRALEARMDAATAEARAFGEAVAGSGAPAHTPRRRPGLPGARRGLPSRRRLLVFAAAAAPAAAGAAIVAGALVLSSGPTAQPASAAEILHQAAMAATASDAPVTTVPGAGQYLFRKEQRLTLQGWRSPLPPVSADIASGGIGMTLSGPHAYNALVPLTVSSWTDSKGGGRRREVLGTLQFWSKKEEARWQAAGSPLPSPSTRNTSSATKPPSSNTRWRRTRVWSTRNPKAGAISTSPTPRSCRPKRRPCDGRPKPTSSNTPASTTSAASHRSSSTPRKRRRNC